MKYQACIHVCVSMPRFHNEYMCTGKSILKPTQLLEFLGFPINRVVMGLSLPPAKIKKIQVQSLKLLEVWQLSAKASPV